MDLCLYPLLCCLRTTGCEAQGGGVEQGRTGAGERGSGGGQRSGSGREGGAVQSQARKSAAIRKLKKSVLPELLPEEGGLTESCVR